MLIQNIIKFAISLLLIFSADAVKALEFIKLGQSTTYVWMDDEGIKHFSSTKPDDSKNIETKITTYPIYGPSPGWILLGTSDTANPKFWEYQLFKTNNQFRKVWAQISTSKALSGLTTRPTVDIKHLYEFNCLTKQVRTLQSNIFDKYGKTINYFGETDWQYIEPDTVQSNLSVAVCSAKPKSK